MTEFLKSVTIGIVSVFVWILQFPMKTTVITIENCRIGRCHAKSIFDAVTKQIALLVSLYNPYEVKLVCLQCTFGVTHVHSYSRVFWFSLYYINIKNLNKWKKDEQKKTQKITKPNYNFFFYFWINFRNLINFFY